MDINTTTSVIPSAVPDDDHVNMLRNDGFEVHVFRGMKKREGRMEEIRKVVIKFPCAKDSYHIYDSNLENNGLCPIGTLIGRQVEDLRNDPSFIYEGPRDSPRKENSEI